MEPKQNQVCPIVNQISKGIEMSEETSNAGAEEHKDTSTEDVARALVATAMEQASEEPETTWHTAGVFVESCNATVNLVMETKFQVRRNKKDGVRRIKVGDSIYETDAIIPFINTYRKFIKFEKLTIGLKLAKVASLNDESEQSIYNLYSEDEDRDDTDNHIVHLMDSEGQDAEFMYDVFFNRSEWVPVEHSTQWDELDNIKSVIDEYINNVDPVFDLVPQSGMIEGIRKSDDSAERMMLTFTGRGRIALNELKPGGETEVLNLEQFEGFVRKLRKSGWKFAIHPNPVAVGMYMKDVDPEGAVMMGTFTNESQSEKAIEELSQGRGKVVTFVQDIGSGPEVIAYSSMSEILGALRQSRQIWFERNIEQPVIAKVGQVNKAYSMLVKPLNTLASYNELTEAIVDEMNASDIFSTIRNKPAERPAAESKKQSEPALEVMQKASESNENGQDGAESQPDWKDDLLKLKEEMKGQEDQDTEEIEETE